MTLLKTGNPSSVSSPPSPQLHALKTECRTLLFEEKFQILLLKRIPITVFFGKNVAWRLRRWTGPPIQLCFRAQQHGQHWLKPRGHTGQSFKALRNGHFEFKVTHQIQNLPDLYSGGISRHSRGVPYSQKYVYLCKSFILV